MTNQRLYSNLTIQLQSTQLFEMNFITLLTTNFRISFVQNGLYKLLICFMQKKNKSIDQIPIPSNSPVITKQDIQNAKSIYDGEYCDVFCVTKNDKKYAVKVIYNNRINLDRLEEEMNQVYLQITTLYSIKHSGVIQLLGHFQRDGTTGLIFPMFGRPISEFIRDRKKKLKTNKLFTINDFVKIFRGVGGAIFQLYSLGFAHRDISEDNILIDDNYNTKLIDLGFLGNIQSCKGRLGTREYFAPEMISRKWYNHKVDVWSFGILCYKLLYGILLFKPKAKNLSEEELDDQYLKNMQEPIEDLPDEKLLLDEKPSEQMLSYIKSMLNFNPDKRPEIGYLLSKKVFGAEEREAATYTINEYVRQKTFRKSNKAQGVMHSNIKQMNVSELQETLFSLNQVKIAELNKQKQLYIVLVKEQYKLENQKLLKHKNIQL